jgi:manganese/zinc/iron transport system permease protein
MFDLGVFTIAILVSCACAISGVFLVLRKMSMTADAISHSVLLGIVIAYMAGAALDSPLLMIGAVAVGVISVALSESLTKSKAMSEEAATGAVFPLLFSVAIIIISLKYRGVHLDVDAVLLGNLEFASMNKLIIAGVDLGSKGLYQNGAVLILNLIFVLLFYKELSAVCFDFTHAAVMGIMPSAVHYFLMSMVSLTAVASFDAAGSILVIALMTGPAATALLLTKRLKNVLIYSVIIAAFNAGVGYFTAIIYDISISGAISVLTLLVFLTVLFFSNNGVVAQSIMHLRQKKDIAMLLFLTNIDNFKSKNIIKKAEKKCYIIINKGYILTEKGKEFIIKIQNLYGIGKIM